jgi:hypothetical protein
MVVLQRVRGKRTSEIIDAARGCEIDGTMQMEEKRMEKERMRMDELTKPYLN